MQPITDVSPESRDTLRRRALLDEAGRLSRALYKANPDSYYKQPEYERAKELFRSVDIPTLALLRHQLRSPELKPPQDFDNSFSQHVWQDAVEHVVATRSRLLAQRASQNSKKGGRLLLYFPHENLACGAAEYSSNGFFDDNNAPPWDTWIRYDGSVLTSFVPTVLVTLAQEGIDANPEQCIQWAPE